MSVLLFHPEKDDGMVALAESLIAGERASDRQYVHDGNYLLVEGPAHVVAHDVAELEKLGYHIATAQEQQDYAGKKKKSGSLKEKDAKSGN